MKIKLTILLLTIFLSISSLFSTEPQILEFNNRPIVDVLMVLADLSEKNIIPDNSVSGKCSYYFTTEDMDEALALFLKSQNLFITAMDSAFEVSKIFSEVNTEGSISLLTTDTDIKMVLDRLTAVTGVTILYDNLPRSITTLNIRELPLKSI